MINQARRLLDHVRSRGDLAASVLLQYIHQKQEPGLPLNQRERTPPKGLLLSKAMFKIAAICIVFMSKAILDHPHGNNARNTEGLWLCFETQNWQIILQDQLCMFHMLPKRYMMYEMMTRSLIPSVLHKFFFHRVFNVPEEAEQLCVCSGLLSQYLWGN